MDCKSAEQLLSPWLDGELAPQQAAHLEKHLGGCPVCAAKAEEMRRLNQALDGAGYAPLPEGLPDRTMEALRRESGSLGLASWWRSLSMGMRGAACGLAAAGLILGLVMAGALSAGGEVNQYYTQLAAVDNGGLWQ